MAAVPSDATPWRRDVADAARALGRWVGHAFGPEAVLGGCTMPANGMANETVLFDVGEDRYVARLAPLEGAPYPTFPTFDRQFQRDCLKLVRARTEVPVPEIVRLEEDSSWLGTPFLVMRRVEGEVPGDSPPYVVHGWMTELSAPDLALLEECTVSILAGIHTVGDPADLERMVPPGQTGSVVHRQLDAQRAYYEWARDGHTVPALEEAFAVLGGSVPSSDRLVLNWGDSRIGNVIYRECRPVAVLDWEMATAGPPEVDVAWMVFMHAFMQDMVGGYGLRGIPDLLRRERVVELYERKSGSRLDELAWYEAFAGLRFGIILLRMGLRSIAFGQMPPAEDPDSLIRFAPLLRRLVAAVQT